MRKTKLSLLALVIALAAALGVAAVAKSQNANGNSSGGNGKSDSGSSAQNNNVSQSNLKNNNGNSGGQAAVQNGRNADDVVDDPDDEDAGPVTNATGKNLGQETAALHRSIVASFVQSLLAVAEQDSAIGPQVKVIAQQQNQDEAVTDEALQSVETRGKIKTFLVGSDYKNLGALRSQYVHTRNRIRQLTRLMNDTQDETVKATLATQIQTLNTDMTNLNKFITDNENQFSLFGWFFKLFNPAVAPQDSASDTTTAPEPVPLPLPAPAPGGTYPQSP